MRGGYFVGILQLLRKPSRARSGFSVAQDWHRHLHSMLMSTCACVSPQAEATHHGSMATVTCMGRPILESNPKDVKPDWSKQLACSSSFHSVAL